MLGSTTKERAPAFFESNTCHTVTLSATALLPPTTTEADELTVPSYTLPSGVAVNERGALVMLALNEVVGEIE